MVSGYGFQKTRCLSCGRKNTKKIFPFSFIMMIYEYINTYTFHLFILIFTYLITVQ